jgi:peptide/nickel transport system substrate-binding protein
MSHWLAFLVLVGAACAPAAPAAPTAAPPAPAAQPTAAPAAAATAVPQVQAKPTIAPAAVAATTAPAPAATAAPAAPTQAAKTGPTPRRGGSIVMATTADVDNLDPALTGGTIASQLKRMIYSSLVRQLPDKTLKPDLASSWQVSPDGQTWTFNLVKGVKFHDGTPFNAQAVKYHFDRLYSAERPQTFRNFEPYLDRVEVVDDNTVRMITKFPDAFFLERVAGARYASPDAHQKYGKDLAKNPVGTGPFKFKEWIPDVRVVLLRNDDYFGEKAYLDQITIRAVPEAGARTIGLESGDIQLADAIASEHIERLKRNPNVNVSIRPTFNQLTVGMQVTKKPFDELKVRQALNYAVDTQTIGKTIYDGLADVLPGPAPKAATGFSPVEGYAYDPARAKQLLAEAGYPGGFSTTITSTKGRYVKDFELVQALQQQFKAVGVDLKVDVVEWARYLELVNLTPSQTPMEMWLDGWNGDNVVDTLTVRFGCEYQRPKGANVHGYCNREVDKAVDEARRTLDDTRRTALLKVALDNVARDAPSVWGLTTTTIAAWNAKLHDPVHGPGESLSVDEHTWLEQ